jgi:hypothetical protein
MSSDRDLMVLSRAKRRLEIAHGLREIMGKLKLTVNEEKTRICKVPGGLARCIPDRAGLSRTGNTITDVIRARAFAICCRCQDADDLDVLHSDPAFKFAFGRLPDSRRDLCLQPPLANAPRVKNVIRLTYALVYQWMASYSTAPSSVTLGIDDICESAQR